MFTTFKTGTITVYPVFFIISIFFLTTCSGTPVGNASRGQRWFKMHNCAGCHGEHANDGRAPRIAALDKSFSSFVRFLRSPGSVSMPDFPEKELSNQDAADIYAWLKSLRK